MTREMKFRIWDGSQMNYDVLVGKLGAYYASIDPADTASVINTKYPGNIIPMQFTGLIDDRGDDIYEGDVISDDKNSHEIFYSEEHASFRAKSLGWNPLGGSCPINQDWIEDHKKVIIRNIYQ